jgi:hypothetical protein
MFMTYNSLVKEIRETLHREGDAEFISNIPNFIYHAHDRINADCKNIGLEQYVVGAFTEGDPVITKPARWRRTLNINYGAGAAFNIRTILKLRSYEFLINYWPDLTELGEPKFYADYGFSHISIVPTPGLAYPFELCYLELPEPLTENNQTNWLTDYAPSLLLYACLLEAVIYLRDDERIAAMNGQYRAIVDALNTQDNQRKVDRSSNRNAD